MESFHTKEVWLDVNFSIWGKYYCVSNYGRIKNKISDKILKPSVSKNGYASVTLKRKPHKWCVAVHTLILYSFKGPPPSSKHECCHGNSIKTDNRLLNLKWGTRKQNHHDKIIRGTTGRKFNEEQVSKIKELLNEGKNPHAISKLFKVKAQTIANIKEGKSYVI